MTAVNEKIVNVSVYHPASDCLILANKIKAKYNLRYCEIAHTNQEVQSTSSGIKNAVAKMLSHHLLRTDSIAIALDTCDEIHAAANQIQALVRPQHKFISLVSNIGPAGSTLKSDIVRMIAEKFSAQYFPLPFPTFATSKAERDSIMDQRQFKMLVDIAHSSDLTIKCINSIDENSRLLLEGFINLNEIRALKSVGSTGIINGWAYDENGNMLQGLTNDRSLGIPLARQPKSNFIGISIDSTSTEAIRSAIRGNLINGLITDRNTANKLLNL